MKFKDLLDAVGERKDWIKLHADWKLTNDGQVAVNFPVNLTLDSEVEVHYQWFWHCNPEVNTTEICDAIDQHDYDTFCKWLKRLDETEVPFSYLPCDAAIWVENEYIGEVCVAFSEQTFKLITSQDHECG